MSGDATLKAFPDQCGREKVNEPMGHSLHLPERFHNAGMARPLATPVRNGPRNPSHLDLDVRQDDGQLASGTCVLSP